MAFQQLTHLLQFNLKLKHQIFVFLGLLRLQKKMINILSHTLKDSILALRVYFLFSLSLSLSHTHTHTFQQNQLLILFSLSGTPLKMIWGYIAWICSKNSLLSWLQPPRNNLRSCLQLVTRRITVASVKSHEPLKFRAFSLTQKCEPKPAFINASSSWPVTGLGEMHQKE